MSATMERLGIDRMSLEERMTLVQDIWDSIAAMPRTAPISEELRRELNRRLADHLANPHDVIPWEQAEAEALVRMKQ